MNSPLSIYIHWPFCKSKCPYCDFNSHVRDAVEHVRWRDGLLRELASYAAHLPGREVVSIFFGGGTPSLMEADTVAALIEAVARHWPLNPQAEITLEANPTSVEAGKFSAFRNAGVNRVSVGVQSLRKEALRFLGRQHSADEARQALQLARDIFPRMTFDLIYARPDQSLVAWEDELREALELARGHLSLYQLTIEENTAFHAAQKRGELPTLDEDTAADMYGMTANIMHDHGMPAYEISNYAAPGQESRHNLTYWRGDDYIGIGPGAHGRYQSYNVPVAGSVLPPCVPGAAPSSEREPLSSSRGAESVFVATENIKSPERWLDRVEALGTGLQAVTPIEPRERMRELVMMGLRLSTGIDYADWQRRTGLDVRAVMDDGVVRRLCVEGLLQADAAQMRVTPQGALVLNSMMGALLA